jgi:hypothetical protein
VTGAAQGGKQLEGGVGQAEVGEHGVQLGLEVGCQPVDAHHHGNRLDLEVRTLARPGVERVVDQVPVPLHDVMRCHRAPPLDRATPTPLIL